MARLKLMTWLRSAAPALGGLIPALAGLACATTFVPARPNEPVASASGARRADVDQVLLTDEVPLDGLGNDSAIVFELTLTNGGPEPWPVSGALFAGLMVLDPQHPAETRALTPVGGAEGRFSGEVPGEGSLIGELSIPPGQTRTYWVLFRGYRFEGSDVPRRIELRSPTPGGPALELVVADPERGGLRWALPAPKSVWNIGFQNVTLFGEHLRATAVSTVIARRFDLRRAYLDVGLLSGVVIETHGALASTTSSFAALGPNVTGTVPLTAWGSELEPRRFGVYAGGSALVLTELQRQPPADPMARPSFYGALAVEAGLALDIGAIRFAATPFPLSPSSAPPPRWSLRVGYTHWWVDGDGTDGYTTSFRLAW